VKVTGERVSIMIVGLMLAAIGGSMWYWLQTHDTPWFFFVLYGSVALLGGGGFMFLVGVGGCFLSDSGSTSSSESPSTSQSSSSRSSSSRPKERTYTDLYDHVTNQTTRYWR
jgi:hypothetical protein